MIKSRVVWRTHQTFLLCPHFQLHSIQGPNTFKRFNINEKTKERRIASSYEEKHRYLPSVNFFIKNFKQIVDAIILYSGNNSIWFWQGNLEYAIIHDYLCTWQKRLNNTLMKPITFLTIKTFSYVLGAYVIGIHNLNFCFPSW